MRIPRIAAALLIGLGAATLGYAQQPTAPSAAAEMGGANDPVRQALRSDG